MNDLYQSSNVHSIDSVSIKRDTAKVDEAPFYTIEVTACTAEGNCSTFTMFSSQRIEIITE